MTNCPICGDTWTWHLLNLKGSRTGLKTPLRYCRTCDSFYQRPGYRESEASLHDDLHWHVRKQPEQTAHSAQVIALLRQHHPDGRRLLDIGCGIGTTLLAAGKAGLLATGVEPNHHAARYARDHFSLNVVNALFSSSLLAEQRFDFVIADNVLEHLDDPAAFLKDMFEVLNPGGLIYLAVPPRKGGMARVIFSLLFRNSPRSLFFDNDVHINHFSRTSIGKLIRPLCGSILRQAAPGEFIIQAL